MAFKNYSWRIAILVMGILLCCLALAAAILIWQWYLSSLLLLFLLVFLTGLLFKLVKSNNLKLSKQIEQILANDFNTRYPIQKQGLAFDKLYLALNRLSEFFKERANAKAFDESFLEILLNQLPLGVLLLKKDKVILLNEIAGEFLNLKSPKDTDLLKERAPFFFSNLQELQNKGKAEIELDNKGEVQKWTLAYSHFAVDEQTYQLYTFRNYQLDSEKAEEEISNRLMHVLTHEIMNSISPITSLTDTLNEQLKRVEKQDSADFNDIQTSAYIIKKRSEGLVEFVKRYNLLARLPRLKIDFVTVKEITDEMEQLVVPELKKKGVDFIVKTESQKLRFRADRQLLIQVILNLLKNAEEAFTGEKEARIVLSFDSRDGYNYISISDNAGGVPAEIRENIFLPFFTTKDKASGIGLNLSRKIIQAHHGRLYLRNLKNGSEFRIELPD